MGDMKDSDSPDLNGNDTHAVTDIAELEKLGIHVVTLEERDACLNQAYRHAELLRSLKKTFKENPPKEQPIKIVINLSDREYSCLLYTSRCV